MENLRDIPSHKYGMGSHQNLSTKIMGWGYLRKKVHGWLHQKKSAGPKWGPWPGMAHMGQSPYGPRPIGARAQMGQGPWAPGPSLLGEHLTKKRTLKKILEMCLSCMIL